MFSKVKADLRKHWVSWIGIIGLAIVCPLALIFGPAQAVMIILGWMLIMFGMFLETTEFGKNYKGDK